MVVVVPTYGCGGANGFYLWLWWCKWFSPEVAAVLLDPTYDAGCAIVGVVVEATGSLTSLQYYKDY